MTLLLSCLRWAWRLGLSAVLIALILLALYNSLGRYYAPLLGQYSPWISQQVQRHTGVKLHFSALRGQWRKYELVVDIEDLTLFASGSKEPALALESLSVSLDPWASLLDLSPRLKQISAHGLKLKLAQRADASWGLLGFAKGDKKTTELQPLIDFISRLEKLDISSAWLQLQAKNGEYHQLSQASLLLRQQQDFRRLLLYASGSLGQKLQLNLESRGDLALADIELKAKLDWQDITVEPWLGLFGAKSLVRGGSLSGESWFSYQPDEGLLVQGKLHAKQVQLQSEQAETADSLSLHTNFKWRADELEQMTSGLAWQAWLRDTELVIHPHLHSRPHKQEKAEAPSDDQPLERLYVPKIALTSTSLWASEQALARAFYWRQQGQARLPEWLQVNSDVAASPGIFDPMSLGQWQLGQHIQDLEASSSDWPEDYLSEKRLSGVQVSLDHLDIQPWLSALSRLHNTPDKLRNVIQSLDLRAQLKRVHLNVPYQLVYLSAVGNIEAEAQNLGANAWRGSPALEGIHAYIKANLREGQADLFDRPVQFHLPKVFAQAFAIEKVAGSIVWQIEPQRIYLQGKELALELAVGKEHADIGLEVGLELPLQKAYGEGGLDLLVGLNGASINDVKRYLPKRLEPGLKRWLEQSLSRGEVVQADLLLRGSLKAQSAEQPEVQLYLDTQAADVAYHQAWPQVSDLAAQIWLFDSQIQAWAHSGRLYQTQFKQAKLNLYNQRHPQGLETYIRLFGQASGPSSDVLRFMHQTPLHETLGDFSDEWDLDGRVDLGLVLQVPISSNLPADFANAVPFDVNATLDFSDSILVMPELNLQLNNIDGALVYQQGRGLSSSDFRASLWGQELQGSLDSMLNDDWWIKLQAQTHIDVRALQQWSQLAELGFAQGKTAVNGVIELNSSTSMMHLSSDLTGISIDLPPPFAKSPEQVRKLNLDVPLTQEIRQWQLSLGHDLRAAMNFEGDHYTGGWLHYGDIKSPQGEAGVFAVSARLAELDYDLWLQALEQYQFYTQGQQAKPDAPEVKIKINSLFAERLTGFNYAFDDVAMQAEQLEQSWRLNVLDNVFSGVFEVSEGEQPLQVELHHMDTDLLAQAEQGSESGGVIDPRELIAADFDIHDLHAGKEQWGSWKFKVRPIADGVRIEDIFANVKAAEVEGGDQQSGGAEVLWFFNNGEPYSRFIGKVSTRNFARVLSEWGYDPFLDSDKGSMLADLSWPGAPLDFDMAKAKGHTDFVLNNGLFKETSTAASNTLKVVGILNLDNLLKRLRLDFSDLGGKGLAFEKVKGRFTFNEGELLFLEPIVLEGTASDINFKGKADLLSETVDAELGITLPIGGNLSWVAYLASGFSAAVGIYIVSKLLKTQVEKLTSAVYSISGDWDNPDLKFKRLFDDVEASK